MSLMAYNRGQVTHMWHHTYAFPILQQRRDQRRAHHALHELERPHRRGGGGGGGAEGAAVPEEAAAPAAVGVVEAAAPDALAHALRPLQHLPLRRIRHHPAAHPGRSMLRVYPFPLAM